MEMVALGHPLGPSFPMAFCSTVFSEWLSSSHLKINLPSFRCQIDSMLWTEKSGEEEMKDITRREPLPGK